MNIVRLLDHPTAIVGATGSGKTFSAKGAVEQLLAEGRRVIIIDPTGAWWGLRAGADGDEAGGFPVIIFGGDHADVEITPDGETGKALALALADRDVQAIIDTSEMTGGEKNRFLTPFLEHLYAKNRAALHIVVDEADEVAAQRLADGEQRLFGIFDKIVRRGRIKGFRPLMISQRPAVIHKNVLSQIGTLIAMKLPSPQDRKAIEDWVKGNADADQAREVMKSLPGLARGEGWVWSPADDVLERVTFPPIRTFDSSRTPAIGEVVTAPALASVDVEALRQTMSISSTTKEAAKINKPSAVEIDVAEQRGYRRGVEDGIIQGRIAGIAIGISRARMAIDAIRIDDEENGVPVLIEGRSGDVEVRLRLEPSAKSPRATKSGKPVDLSTASQPGEIGTIASSMLDVLVEAHPQGLPSKLWGAFGGRSPVSGPWHKAVKELLNAGLILGDQNLFNVTPSGIEKASSSPAGLGSEVEVWSHWRETIANILGVAPMDMLQVLARHRPNRLTAREWGLLSSRSPVSGPWHGAIRDLTKWQCIEKDGIEFLVTDKGAAVAAVEGGADTRSKLYDLRLGRLSSLARQIYDVLPGERSELAGRLGKSPISGPWHTAVKELLASGLAAEDAKVIRRAEERLQ